MATAKRKATAGPGPSVPILALPADSMLEAIAEEQARELPGYDNRLPYFLYKDGAEYEPLLAAMRAAWLDGCLTVAALLADGGET